MGEAFWPTMPRAVEVAESLAAEEGEFALNVARSRRQSAILEGRMGRADLYQAVCTILIDDNQVFTRWKAQGR